MELNITRVFNETAPMDYYASRAEIGDNAGADTWRAACDDSADYMMLDDDNKRQAFRDYVRTFGAWNDAEIAAWSDIELNALLLQMIAGDIRDDGLDTDEPDWESEGLKESRIFRGDDNQVYYYLGG